MRRLTRFRSGTLAAALAALALLPAAPAVAQESARVRHQNLAEMVDEAAFAFLGRVVAAHTEPHPQFPGLNTVVVRLEVVEALKGAPGAEYTFRQYVWHPGDARDTLGYRRGQEVVLLLIAPSRYGLSSPAGLEQGRFRVHRDLAGRRSVLNGMNNAGLLREVSARAPRLAQTLPAGARRLLAEHRQGAIDYYDFRELVRSLASGSR